MVRISGGITNARYSVRMVTAAPYLGLRDSLGKFRPDRTERCAILAYTQHNPLCVIWSQAGSAFFRISLPNLSFDNQCTLSASNCRHLKASMLHYLGIMRWIKEWRADYVQRPLNGLERVIFLCIQLRPLWTRCAYNAMYLPDHSFVTSKNSANKMLSPFCKNGKSGAQCGKMEARVHSSLRGTL